MKKFVSLQILLMLLFNQCSNYNELNSRYIYKSDSVIHVDIPSNISSTTRNIRYFEHNNNKYLAVENMHYKSIAIFDLTAKKFIKEIKPQIEGPNGIGSPMFGFDIINFDTIFIATKGMGNMLAIIDSSAKLITKINFNISFSPYMPLPFLFSSFGNSICYNGKQIAINAVSRMAEEEFYESDTCALGYIYDIEKQEQLNCELKQPTIKNLKPEIIYSESCMLINDSKTIVSYELGHQIFVASDNLWSIYNLKSKYVKKPFNPGFGNDIMESQTKFVESPSYLALVYDKYRKVYYRFVYPGIDVTRQDDVMKLGEFRRVFSVMIIDENFNVLGETLMPENTYNSNMFFVNEAGLWISTNHPENPDFEEDAINFQLFTLK